MKYAVAGTGGSEGEGGENLQMHLRLEEQDPLSYW
jgi:hypothetical protein